MPTATTSTEVACSLGIAPSGRVQFRRGDAFAHPIPATSAAAIEEAFARGSGQGLLHLGSVEASGDLGPTVNFWREAAKLYLTKLCTLLDLDEAIAKGLETPLEPGEAAALLAAAPPMLGTEYLDADVLRQVWSAMEATFLELLGASGQRAEELLHTLNPLWRSVGRVFFHLAENKARRDLPFAFLATYTSRISSRGKLQHVPLGKAVKELADSANKSALLALLVPVQRASTQSSFVKELADSGRLFQPQAWTAADAYRFLREVPALEANGIFVRVPDWWNPRQPPRVQVSVTVGKNKAAGFGADALLDFSVDMSLDGEPISSAEWREILAGQGSLALVKGRWVEVDREKLAEVLQRWKDVEKATRGTGISFHEGMRLLSRWPSAVEQGPQSGALAGDAASPWLTVSAGEWLRSVIEELTGTTQEALPLLEGDLHATLRPYQSIGVRWLWFLHKLRLGGCLADDMGLGKTIQVLGLLLCKKREGGSAASRLPALLVVPASLIANWKSECARFAPVLRLVVAHPSEPDAPLKAAPPALGDVDLVITTYSMIARLEWIRDSKWSLIVLDEAQAIKNPGAQQTRAVKGLKGLHRLALTGTPVENRLADLWSLFDFLSPGLLGGAKEFNRLTKSGGDPGESYARVRTLVRPYILRRLKTDKRVISDLPDKQEVKVYCGLKKTQAVLYQKSVDELARSLKGLDGIRRRGIVLAFITRLKQICNHPSQWTGDGAYDPDESGKTARLAEICAEIAARQDKVLVFTQFQEVTAMLASLLERVFGRPGPILDGGTPVRKRKEIVEAFQREEGPPFFILSLKAGGTGLNLTAASHVIHFDRWWNPAVENQATDRAFRIGQKRNVLVHKFVCRGTVEERIDELLEQKKGMAEDILKDSAEAVLTEMGNEELMRFVALDTRRAGSE